VKKQEEEEIVYFIPLKEKIEMTFKILECQLAISTVVMAILRAFFVIIYKF
jgi:hypothetical protein